MSRVFRTPITLALMAALAGPVLAQEAAQPPVAVAAVTLPKALQDAGLTEVTSKPGRHDGTRIRGKLPDGTQLEAMLDAQGALRGLRTRDEAALPPALVAQIVPQAVRDSAIFAEIGSLKGAFMDERGVMLIGQDAGQNRIRAAFAQDGTLLRFGRGDKEDGPGFDRDKGRRHGDDHRDGRHGKGRDHDRREGHGDDAPPPPEGMPAPQQQGALVERGEVRLALTSAGYSRIGEITQEGPRVIAQATNPEGEPVLVELSPEGRVLREINR